MRLEFVKEEVCSECGCTRIEIETDRGAHCNGERRQTRKFWCGRQVTWVPNFSRIEVDKQCGRSKEAQTEKDEYERLRLKFNSLIKKSKLRPDTKKKLLRSVNVHAFCKYGWLDEDGDEVF